MKSRKRELLDDIVYGRLSFEHTKSTPEWEKSVSGGLCLISNLVIKCFSDISVRELNINSKPDQLISLKKAKLEAMRLSLLDFINPERLS